MKLILLHFLVSSAVTYIAAVTLIMGIIGIVNLLRRKPFLDRWRHNLSDCSFWLIVVLLADLVPPHLRFTVALPVCVLLFGVVFFHQVFKIFKRR